MPRKFTLREINERLRGENLSNVGEEAQHHLRAYEIEGYELVKVSDDAPDSDDLGDSDRVSTKSEEAEKEVAKAKKDLEREEAEAVDKAKELNKELDDVDKAKDKLAKAKAKGVDPF